MKKDIGPKPHARHLSSPRQPVRRSDKGTQKESPPVMCWHPAVGGLSTRLERGSTPSTPHVATWRKRSDSRRMSVKKYFRVTPHEAAVISARAAEAGLEQASYIRAQTLGLSKVRAARRIRADWDELRRCMGAINRAGNVVNQLVLELRRTGRSSGLAHVALKELIAAAHSVMSALGRC
ncbi:hypothetical protein [Paludibacterium sp.]|uniref:plasmid mobilization protein n=1 Tax=Paludibacterium sp. TaxID=1917523 RepID=UPI0025D2644D|nr:hypothetical protein [Paludibacterium sp.]MBV8648456.1 hypothetical protein [Paludibacterium sp.]